MTERERLDDLQYKERRIIQDIDTYCFAADAVCLARFATYRKQDRVLELGTGTGVIPLLMADEVAKVDALELNTRLVNLATRNVTLNNLADKITVRQGDLRQISELYPAACFDLVLANPPYYPLGQGKVSANPLVAAAKHEVTATLDEVIGAARYALKPNGRIAMVHRTLRLTEVFMAWQKAGITPKRLQLVQDNNHTPPAIFLLEGTVGGGKGLKILPTLFLSNI